MIEEFVFENKLCAIIIRSHFSHEGIKFFTPNEYSQQLAYMKRPRGYVIAPHIHNPVKRVVNYTKEVLFVRSGQLRVDFYRESQEYIESRILETGDVIFLAFGGHGFEILSDAEIIEVKQGPYAGENDKTRFAPVENRMVKIGSSAIHCTRQHPSL
ncbi:MAG: hypothetical protein HYW48_11340 [Deltaproteobacteria bacterium]|nr:hypothetical protein [Deltaproteobacteria bacterium]